MIQFISATAGALAFAALLYAAGGMMLPKLAWAGIGCGGAGDQALKAAAVSISNFPPVIRTRKTAEP